MVKRLNKLSELSDFEVVIEDGQGGWMNFTPNSGSVVADFLIKAAMSIPKSKKIDKAPKDPHEPTPGKVYHDQPPGEKTHKPKVDRKKNKPRPKNLPDQPKQKKVDSGY